MKFPREGANAPNEQCLYSLLVFFFASLQIIRQHISIFYAWIFVAVGFIFNRWANPEAMRFGGKPWLTQAPWLRFVNKPGHIPDFPTALSWVQTTPDPPPPSQHLFFPTSTFSKPPPPGSLRKPASWAVAGGGHRHWRYQLVSIKPSICILGLLPGILAFWCEIPPQSDDDLLAFQPLFNATRF